MELNRKRRTMEHGEWFFVYNDLLSKFEYPGTLKPYLIAVYCSLARHADKKQVCFPSQELIAKETGMSVRTVKKAVKVLAERGLIIIKRSHRNRKTRNWYLLTHTTEWIMQGALGALGSVRQMPTNKTHKNKTKISKNENGNQTNALRERLVAKMTLPNNRSP